MRPGRDRLARLSAHDSVPPEERVRYGVIGVGGFGSVHLRSVAENPAAELVALVDVDPEVARTRAGEFGVRAFDSASALVAADLVDAVSVVVPHDLHAAIALECLRAGIHVFVEKPMALRLSEADAMVGAAREAGVKLCVGHQYRTFRGSRVLKLLMETNTLGAIRHGTWSHHADARSSRASGGWKRDWKRSGGGFVAYRAIHDLDLLCWMLGWPAEVVALGPPSRDRPGHHALVRFGSEAVVSFQTSLAPAGLPNPRQLSGELGSVSIVNARSLDYDKGEHMMLELLGESEARFEVDIPQALYGPPASIRALDGTAGGASEGPPGLGGLLESFATLPRPKRHGTTDLLDAFVASVLEGVEPPVTGESALGAMELHHAMLLSGGTGHAVGIPVDRAEYDDFFERAGRDGPERTRVHRA